MSKKKKAHYVASEMKVISVGETITFNKNEEVNRMGSEWFYLDDITWYKAVDGRIVAPVAGVVKHLDKPKDGCRVMYVSAAEQCIVDVTPFRKGYEKSSLERLWNRMNPGAEDGLNVKKQEVKECTSDVKDCTDETKNEENKASEEG